MSIKTLLPRICIAAILALLIGMAGFLTPLSILEKHDVLPLCISIFFLSGLLGLIASIFLWIFTLKEILLRIVLSAIVLFFIFGVFMAALWPAIAARPTTMHRQECFAVLGAAGDSLLLYEQQNMHVAPSLDEALKYALAKGHIDQNSANQITAHYSELTYFARSIKDKTQPPVIMLHMESTNKVDFDLYSDFTIKQAK